MDKKETGKGKKQVKPAIVAELENFRNQLMRYYIHRRKVIMDERTLTKEESANANRLYAELGATAGKFSSLIHELTGVSKVSTKDGTYDVWYAALSTVANPLIVSALDLCIQAITRAIGKLEDDIKQGIRDDQTGTLLVSSSQGQFKIPKAFIAHGGNSTTLNKLNEFLQALGLDPTAVNLLPSRGMSLEDKVDQYIKDADCGIVLAIRDVAIKEKTKKPNQHPRPNIINEIERLRAAFPDKTILLVEKGVALPATVTGLTYEPFTRQSLDRAFIKIARKLHKFGILKAIKPQE